METTADCQSCGRPADPDPSRWRRPLGTAGAVVGLVLPGRIGVYFPTLPLGLRSGLRVSRQTAARLGDWPCPLYGHAVTGDATRRASDEPTEDDN